ncbi:MAG: 3-deoxy-7-phosphoheptulonate synthase [Armatimonadetes bacterium]|nr:3-deoxy-7-phosphoheptulonate synthase [Armatimonadota bacterium]
MIIVMVPGAKEADIKRVLARLEQRGYGHHVSAGVERTIIGAIGANEREKQQVAEQLMGLPGVERVVPILKPYKLVSRDHHPEGTVVTIGTARFGAGKVGVIAGPCTIESEKQLREAALAVKNAGAVVLRGGAFKPRSSPYDFQGLREEGVELLGAIGQEVELPTITEVMEPRQIEVVLQHVDALQIGARNMSNFDLLREAGATGRTIMLKRGYAATVEEWLKAAEYVATSGNLNILLCERGIRSFDSITRFTLDLGGMAAAKLETHLPIIVDPSHATGTHKLVSPMALAAVAGGADGLMIEVHPHPDQARCDGPQSLTPKRFASLMDQVRSLVQVMGETM